MRDVTLEPQSDNRNPELESTESLERDAKGVGYIVNLIGVYALFFIFMIAIAWFGIFSEV